MSTEMVKGIGPAEYPQLLGYVCTTPKSRAEIPLVTQKGDPLLAHWQFGLGRAVAWTSDAKPSGRPTGWAGTNTASSGCKSPSGACGASRPPISPPRSRWKKARATSASRPLTPRGNYRNFLNLDTLVVSPKGQEQIVRLEQTGPGHYEAKFPTKEVGRLFDEPARPRLGTVASLWA